jgi:hypothetical protein
MCSKLTRKSDSGGGVAAAAATGATHTLNPTHRGVAALARLADEKVCRLLRHLDRLRAVGDAQEGRPLQDGQQNKTPFGSGIATHTQ